LRYDGEKTANRSFALSALLSSSRKNLEDISGHIVELAFALYHTGPVNRVWRVFTCTIDGAHTRWPKLVSASGQSSPRWMPRCRRDHIRDLCATTSNPTFPSASVLGENRQQGDAHADHAAGSGFRSSSHPGRPPRRAGSLPSPCSGARLFLWALRTRWAAIFSPCRPSFVKSLGAEPDA
jgi:hypothetical protein